MPLCYVLSVLAPCWASVAQHGSCWTCTIVSSLGSYPTLVEKIVWSYISWRDSFDIQHVFVETVIVALFGTSWCECIQVQGMSFVAAVLLLNMDVHDAFTCFANLLNRPCQIAFFRLDKNLVCLNVLSDQCEVWWCFDLVCLHFDYFSSAACQQLSRRSGSIYWSSQHGIILFIVEICCVLITFLHCWLCCRWRCILIRTRSFSEKTCQNFTCISLSVVLQLICIWLTGKQRH